MFNKNLLKFSFSFLQFNQKACFCLILRLFSFDTPAQNFKFSLVFLQNISHPLIFSAISLQTFILYCFVATFAPNSCSNFQFCLSKFFKISVNSIISSSFHYKLLFQIIFSLLLPQIPAQIFNFSFEFLQNIILFSFFLSISKQTLILNCFFAAFAPNSCSNFQFFALKFLQTIHSLCFSSFSLHNFISYYFFATFRRKVLLKFTFFFQFLQNNSHTL